MNSSTKKIIASPLIQKIFSSRLSKFILRNTTAVFLYHEVSNQPSQFHQQYNLNVPPDLFEMHIKTIKKHFNLIYPNDLIKNDYQKPAALITFDDGAKGVFDNALPILEKHQCPSLTFLNMAPVEGDLFYSGLVTYLCDYDHAFIDFLTNDKKLKSRPYFLHCRPSWVDEYLSQNNRNEIIHCAQQFYGTFATINDLKYWAKSPYAFWGNHLYQHYNTITCDKNELISQYTKNQQKLSPFKNSTHFFSYPFGQENTCYNLETHTTIRNMGAKALFLAHEKNFKIENNIIPRLAMDQNLNNKEKILTYICLKKIKSMQL